MKASKLIAIAAVASVLHLAASAEEVENKLEGVVKVSAFDLPESAYLSDESRSAMKYFRDVYLPEFRTFVAKSVKRRKACWAFDSELRYSLLTECTV